MPFISVIIPVYNAAPYLEQCVESLLSQTFQDIELIFINDGSTDDSLKILKKYKIDCPGLILVDQKNAGVSVARNKGIALAKGKYVAFVDADDWVPKKLYEKLSAIVKSTNVDLILFNTKSFLEGKTCVRHFDYPANCLLDEKFIQENLYRDLIKNDDLFSPCDKLYRKQVIDCNDISFPPGNALSEDNLFNLQFFGKIKSFYYENYTGYFYREVVGSATRNIATGDYFENQRQLYHLDYTKFFSSDFSAEEIREFKAMRFLKVVVALINIYFTQPASLSLKERVKYVKNMIYSSEVKQALLNACKSLTNEANRYEKAILFAIKKRSTFVLLLLTKYSQLRNRS